jgi:choline-sulfatase
MTRRALLATAAAVLAGALLLPWPVWWRERAVRSTPRPLDVLLVTLDTTRADRLGCYGDARARTPNLDGLAREGVLFRHAYAHVPLTSPSHASILTGVFPPRHGVHDNGGFVLGPDLPTLAERFVDAGYRTGAFVSAFVLDRRFGLARGFATYNDDMRGSAASRGPRDQALAIGSAVTVPRALAWWSRDDRRPRFLWVHLYDPHAPYDPPEPEAGAFRADPYRGEIAHMDAQLGALLRAVRRPPPGRAPALVAVVGDHGESLGEHGEPTHNYFIYEATQRVPLLLSLPGHLPAGRMVDPVVRAVDVMPSILEMAGLPVPPGLDGRSLVPLVTGASDKEPGPAYLESYHPRLWWGSRELLGLRTGPWLYIRSPRPELYDVERDPGATSNVAAGQPLEVDRLAQRLAQLVGVGDPLSRRTTVDPGVARNLQALGYLGGGVEARADGGKALPDAKDNAALLDGMHRATALSEQGRREEAVDVLERTLALGPRSSALRTRLAQTLYELGRFDQAYDAFALLAQGGSNEHYSLGLSLCRQGQGRTADALEEVRSGLREFPQAPRLHEQAGRVLLALGQTREGELELRTALRLAPGQGRSSLLLASALEAQGRSREAAGVLRELVARDPASVEAGEAGPRLADLGTELLRENTPDEAREAYRAARAAGVDDEALDLNLALACYRERRLAEGVEVLGESLGRRPDSTALRYRRGQLLEEMGRLDEARADYVAVAARDERARAALARLGTKG